MQQDIDPKLFRKALGTFTTGVTIITAADTTAGDVGMTVNSFSSVSLAPPMVLWSLGRTSTNVEAFLRAEHFAVHVLATEQDELATRFATKDVDRFAGTTVGRGVAGVPLLDEVVARFECRTAHQYEGGDHVIIVGEVLAFTHWDREPLVFKGGRYAIATDKPAEPKPPPALPVQK